VSRPTLAEQYIDCAACFERPNGDWQPANTATRTYNGSVWLAGVEVAHGPMWVCAICYKRLTKRDKRLADRLAATTA